MSIKINTNPLFDFSTEKIEKIYPSKFNVHNCFLEMKRMKSRGWDIRRIEIFLDTYSGEIKVGSFFSASTLDSYIVLFRTAESRKILDKLLQLELENGDPEKYLLKRSKLRINSFARRLKQASLSKTSRIDFRSVLNPQETQNKIKLSRLFLNENSNLMDYLNAQSDKKFCLGNSKNKRDQLLEKTNYDWLCNDISDSLLQPFLPKKIRLDILKSSVAADIYCMSQPIDKNENLIIDDLLNSANPKISLKFLLKNIFLFFSEFKNKYPEKYLDIFCSKVHPVIASIQDFDTFVTKSYAILDHTSDQFKTKILSMIKQTEVSPNFKKFVLENQKVIERSKAIDFKKVGLKFLPNNLFQTKDGLLTKKGLDFYNLTETDLKMIKKEIEFERLRVLNNLFSEKAGVKYTFASKTFWIDDNNVENLDSAKYICFGKLNALVKKANSFVKSEKGVDKILLEIKQKSCQAQKILQVDFDVNEKEKGTEWHTYNRQLITGSQYNPTVMDGVDLTAENISPVAVLASFLYHLDSSYRLSEYSNTSGLKYEKNSFVKKLLSGMSLDSFKKNYRFVIPDLGDIGEKLVNSKKIIIYDKNDLDPRLLNSQGKYILSDISSWPEQLRTQMTDKSEDNSFDISR